ncbi:MAG: hypothetical protein NC218_10240 [Acetobacter sp.]|nr:hypothetical protein [Acetobacter sp.]
MTIQSETSKVVYTGDGETKEFAVPFYFFAEQINVYKNFSETPLRLGADYLVSNTNNYNGGEVIFWLAPKVGDTITITRNVELKQLITFLEGEDFPAKDFEYALDKITMALQQLRECIARAIVVPNGATINKDDVFHCLELLNQYWDNIMAVPDIVDNLLNASTDSVTEGDKRLITSGGVQKYAYSKNMVDAKINTLAQKIYHTSVSIAPSTVQESDECEGYPYKFNIAIEQAEATHCPVVMFNQEDAQSGHFAPYASAYNGGVSIYLKEDITLDTTIPLILLM